MMMTSTTLTTAPVTKSVQHVPKKVRMRVPINTRVGVRDFFFAKRGLFGVQSRERFGVRFCEAIDRICVCIIDIVFVSGYLSATVGVVVVSFASTDQKTRKLLLLLSRARERERATVLIIQPFIIVARDKEGQNEGGRGGPSWMMMM